MAELKWIKHDGGPMPVPGDTIVKIKRADGEIWPHDPSRADAFLATPKHPTQSDWWMDGEAYTEDAQIVEYAIVTPSASAPQPAIDAHYTKYAIQPMEFSLANGLDAAQHTVVKYTVRYRDKGGIRDLRAAIRVLELMIEREEKAQANG